MSRIMGDGDEPAFPMLDSEEEGMSIRDYFAAKAMQGYVMGWPQSDSKVEHLPTIAKMSYKIADAMCKERDK